MNYSSNSSVLSCILLPMEIPIDIKRSKRSRNLRLSVKAGGAVILTAPMKTPIRDIELFVKNNQEWIKEKVRTQKLVKDSLLKTSNLREFKEKRDVMLIDMQRRVEIQNQHYRFSFNSVDIIKSKTKWGSCSSRKKLSFNYKMSELSDELQDYIVVHEICHLKEMNHGPKFWKLVAETIPHHKLLRKKLRIGAD